MKEKKTLILLMAGMVILIAGAAVLYNRLSEGYGGNLMVRENEESRQEQPENLSDSGTESELSEAKPGAEEATGSTGADKGSAGAEAGSTGTDEGSAGAEAGSTGTDTGNTQADNAEQETDTGEELVMAPVFSVTDAEGNTVQLSDFYGKPIVVNFWASWCGPCKSEMPDFEEAYITYGEDVNFLMVNMTDGGRETVETAQEYIKGQGFTFPVYFDTSQEAAVTYGVLSNPSTYFIDSEGYAVAYAQGAITSDVLKTGLNMIYAP